MRCNTIVFWLGRSSYEDSGNNNSGRHHRTNYWFDFYKAQRFSPEPFPILVVVLNTISKKLLINVNCMYVQLLYYRG